MSKVQLAILAIVAFTSASGYVLHSIFGIGAYHQNLLWALGTSVIFLIILLVNVWMFFAISGEDAFRWDPEA